MTVFEALILMLTFSTFLVALLSYLAAGRRPPAKGGFSERKSADRDKRK